MAVASQPLFFISVQFEALQPSGPALPMVIGINRRDLSGYLKARVTLRDGKPVEQTFWKDGEKKE